ncbi:MAG: formate dehydrogenase accessory sulfurtransferase FdhD [Flavobacteriaceae bacterium]|nr:formate dehydrogenase accessory sulfurtransferase FdhD [Flavobacteriaceae bacterium]
MTNEIHIRKITTEQSIEKQDVVATEEPLEIHLEFVDQGKIVSKNISVTMRTPGNDDQLATGFLFTEGIIKKPSDLEENPIRVWGENSVVVRLNSQAQVQLDKLHRNFYTTSSCGVCGKDSIFAVYQTRPKYISQSEIQISKEIIFQLPQKLREVQKTFISTGGIHAAALFDKAGQLLQMREDVGRHNALDKLIGHYILHEKEKIPMQDKILLLSGRASFELIQKAAMAGIQCVCAVGAPSSLAVETASTFKITLIGFLKPESFNIYTENQRITK